VRLSASMKRAALAAASWLAILGFAATAIGVHDAIDASEINVRLVGALLLVAGIVMLSGAVGLSRRTPVGLSLAMIAALLGVLVGIMMFLTQVANDEPDQRLAAWALIIVASGAAALCVRAALPSDERPQTIWSRLPILKSAISVGVLASVAQFWYSQIYLPTKAPPILTIEMKVDKVTPRAGHLILQGSAVVRNASDTKVALLASTLDIRGTRLSATRIKPEEFTGLVGDAESASFGMANRYVIQGPESVISHGRLLHDAYLDAGEAVTVPILTWLPKHKYSAVHLDAAVWGGRANALELEDATQTNSLSTTDGLFSETNALPTKDGVFYVTRLPEASWLQRLTRGERYLRVKYNRYESAIPAVGFARKHEADPSEHFKNRLRTFWQSRVAYGDWTDEKRDELLRNYGLSASASNRDKRRLQLVYGTGVSDPDEDYDRRLTRFYGVTYFSGRASVSLP
jgi:hypothetical protein